MLAKCYLGLAIALFASCFGFTFDGDEVRWFWAEMPTVPYYLVGVSAVLFVFYYRRQASVLAE